MPGPVLDFPIRPRASVSWGRESPRDTRRFSVEAGTESVCAGPWATENSSQPCSFFPRESAGDPGDPDLACAQRH